jgi:asparagine synthetase B (glutamine-hydrolysing)
MAGLFGLVSLRRDPALDRRASEALLDEMAARLAHAPGQPGQRWLDPENGVALARSHSPWLEASAWPALREPEAPLLFADGVLHGGVAKPLPDPDSWASTFSELRGFFAAAIVAPGARRTSIAVDRHASHPIQFCVVDDVLYFAPELKALLAVPGLRKQLDPAALGLLLGGGYVPPGATLLRGVERLHGGEALRIEGGRWRRERYWRYRLSREGDGTPPAELERELGGLLRAAVGRNFARPERTFVLLSGGSDSRALAAAAHELAAGAFPVRTVSWTFGAASEDSDEPVARQLVDRFGFDHSWLPRQVDRFGRDFTRLAYLLEGLSDTPASHPYEMEMIRAIAETGRPCVLRGDECFGWGEPVADAGSALAELGLRPPAGLGRMDALVSSTLLRESDEAARARLDEIAAAQRGRDPDTVRDELYFELRLQGLLNSIAWPKFAVADHRNPLLDEAILDFNTRVPAAHRADKRLFRRACAQAFPEFWRVPFAKRQNLVEWRRQLAGPSALRRFVEAELADSESGAWEIFRREELRAWLRSLEPAPEANARARGRVRGRLRELLRLAPAVERRLRSGYQRRVLRIEDFFGRFLVVKAWLDLFYHGDGGRAAFERRLARAEAIDTGSGT